MAGLGHVRSLDASARVVFFHFPAPTFHGPSTRETIKNRATTRILRGMVYDVGISLDKIVLTSDGFDDTHNETFPSRRRPSEVHARWLLRRESEEIERSAEKSGTIALSAALRQDLGHFQVMAILLGIFTTETDARSYFICHLLFGSVVCYFEAR